MTGSSSPRLIVAPARSAPPLVTCDRRGALPLSFTQQRLWFIEQLEPGGAAYNVSFFFRLHGPVDAAALGRALQAVVTRHESLRTSFAEVGGQPRLVIAATAELALPIESLASVPGDEQREALAVLAQREAQRPFDLAHGPLLRVKLVRLDEESHALIVVTHHIVCDNWSMGILIHEMSVVYQALVAGRPPALPALPVQYADFAVWQRNRLTGPELDRLLDYWRHQLDGVPAVLDLPADRPRPMQRSGRGARLYPELPRELVRALGAFSRSEGVTLYMTLLAAFDALLWRYTGQGDIVVGSPIGGRNRRELEGLIGFFANTLVLRVGVDGALSFRELVQRVRGVSLAAFRHQDVPFEKLVDVLKLERDLSRTPLVQVMFGLQNVPFPRVPLGDSTLEPLLLDAGTATFDLTVSLQERDGAITGWVEYSADLFDRPTIERLMEHYRVLLEAAVARPDARLAQLPLMPDAERRLVVEDWNRTEAAPPLHQSVVDLFLDQLRRTPDAIGVVAGAEQLSYRELDARAERWAQVLRAQGCGRDVRVALALSRGPLFPIAVLAVLKAGAAYVPLDPAYPAERLAFMLADCEARILLTESAIASGLPASAMEVVVMDAPPGPPVDPHPVDPQPGAAPASDDLAYVIYTSGSTGRPKGVAMPHRAVLNLIGFQCARSPGPARTLQFASPSFDVSFQELFATWANGGCVVLAEDDARRDPAQLLQLCVDQRIERLFLPFVVLHQLAEAATERDLTGLPLREVITAGEQLRITPAIAQLFTRLPACRLYNQYGPTETHLATELELRGPPAGWETLPAIGRPITNCRIYVLDPEGQPTPIGVPGELYIAGAGVARGYLGRPDLTAERFVRDPFGPPDVRDARMYRTGDRAKYLPSGDLVFLGRADDQVKIRGFRIELGEIEATLGSHPAVREAAVVARPHAAGTRLIAYVACEDAAAISAADLKAHLRARLPDYMVPAIVMMLPALPVSPNGKLDRKALPAPEVERTSRVAPRTAMEALVARVWEPVLGVTNLDANDSFFEAGGHSLLATQVISRLRAELGVELPVRLLFEAPTLADLALRLEAMTAGAREALPPITRADRTAPLPLSFAQQRLWFVEQLEPGGFTYNVPLFLRLSGALDAAALEAALQLIGSRHEVLRTRFAEHDGEPWQVVDAEQAVALAVEQVTEAGITERALAAARQPFDLAAGPVMRARLLRIRDDDHVLVLVLHHIACDGWSMAILLRELGVAYASARTGTPAQLPALALSYADFAQWQRQWLHGPRLDEQLAYWKRQLADAPPMLDLPTDRPRPAVRSVRGAQVTRVLGGALTTSVRKLGQREGATEFMVLLAAFDVLLAHVTGQRDISVGSPIAGRGRPELEALIGFFVNTLVLRVDTGAPASFRELVRRVREVCLEAYAHQDLPFEKLVDARRSNRDLSRTPLFQVMFAMQNAPTVELDIAGLAVRALDIHPGMARFELSLLVHPGRDGLVTMWEYNTDLFDQATIERMAEHYELLLGRLLADPDERPSVVPLVSPAERDQLLAQGTVRTEYPEHESLHALFEAQVARTPGAPAVVFGDARLSYAELNARANQLARYLAEHGVAAQDRVGICLGRSIDFVVSVLATIKLGACYVPLDPSYPGLRLAYMAADAGVRVVIARRTAGSPDLTGMTGAPVWLDDAAAALAQHADANLPVVATSRDLAYVMYTSGSTGQPKGTCIEQRSITRLVLGTDYIQLGGNDVIAHLSNTSFDAATFEIWGPLLSGASLRGIAPDVVMSPEAFARELAVGGISVVLVTAAVFHQLAALIPRAFRTVQHVFVGGDVVDAAAVRRVLAAGPPRRLINAYGPTETTTIATWHLVSEVDDQARTIPIGRPIANTSVRILDPDRNLVPIGVRGELYVGGPGVARGYWNRPEFTAERFVDDPFEPGGRLYRTGDLATWRSDGAIEFHGRADGQVKLRGFRIELGEIETQLLALAELAAATVVVRDDTGDPRLVAYVVPRDGAVLDLDAIRARLAQVLPHYMVPSALVVLDRLPMTPNGKVDRRALPAPSSRREVSAAPRTAMEEIIGEIWERVLNQEPIGAQDSFFALGGHSLIAMQVLSRVRSVLGIAVPVQTLFEAPTLGAFAHAVQSRLVGGAASPVAQLGQLRPVQRPDKLPLSFAQQRLWFLDRLEPDGFSYNVPVVIRLTGPLRIDVLAGCLDEIVRRHEVLRTRFIEVDGAPEQVVAPVSAVAHTLEVEQLPAGSDAPSELTAWAVRESRRPFSLADGPLLRALLLALGPDDHVLGLMMHHIVCDAWSFGILMRELQALYRARLAGTEPVLPALALQYADYAIRQRELSDEVLSAQLAYWTDQLAGAPDRLELPTDRPRPAVQTTRGAMVHRRLTPEVSAAARDVSRRSGVTLFMTMLAAYYALLHRYSGQSDLVVGSPISGRNHQELEDLIGFFINTLALRVRVSRDTSFQGLLASVREVCLQAHAHQDVPFDSVVDAVRPARDASGTPLFQVMFVLQDAPAALDLPGLTAEALFIHPGMAKFDLTLFIQDTGDELQALWEYNTDLFDQATVERIAAHYGALLEAAIARPDDRLATLPLLGDAERHMIVDGWNRTQTAPWGPASVVELFDDQVQRTPDAIAVIAGEVQLRYRELDARAEQWAKVLRARGCGRGVRVALALPRSHAFPLVMLAVLKAGAAYVPLDLSYPAERLAFMLRDCEARVLITESAVAAALPASEADVLLVDAPPTAPMPGAVPDDAGGAPSSDDLAYVLYTSGSTGRPKGVAMPHGAVLNLIAWQCARSPVPARTLQFASFSFDVSFQELFATWGNGGCVVLAPDEARRDPAELLGMLREHRIERLYLPFVALHQLAEASHGADLGDLRLREVITAGEQLRITPAIAQLFSQLPTCRLYNQYGPTETHAVTELALTGAPASWHPLPSIGRPIANVRIYVLDGELQPTPIGVPGELYIGGVSVARGYIGRPELTAERFVTDPFAPGSPEPRMYRTGDRAKYLASGELVFLGRSDDQVKVRGYRVEPGEIEAALTSHPAVSAAAVVAQVSDGGSRLVAYLAWLDGPATSVAELRRYLSARLPEYMVPAIVVVLPALPLTPNGKVDRRALPKPEVERADLGGGYLAPEGDLEQAIARIWAEVLGVDRVGANDNFFDLGGSSLVLVAARSRLSKLLGRTLPIVVLLQYPQVRSLAAHLAGLGPDPARAPSCLVQLQRGAGTTKPAPMFFVHGGGGHALVYRDLASAIDPDRPAYGFAASGLERDQPLHTSVEDMASHYLELARTVHPDGPYLLVGASLGGMIVYEMARRLSAAGHTVPLCALLDAPAPGMVRTDADAADLLGFVLDAGRWISLDQLRGLPLDDQLERVLAAGRRAGAVLPFGDLAEGRRLVAVWQNNIRAAARYTAPPWPGGEILYMAAGERQPGVWAHPERGWIDRCTARVEVSSGNHFSMVTPPHIAGLGARIRSYLETRTGSTRP